MEVMELAALLGQKIKEDPRVVEMNKAQEAYESDLELQKQIMEYNAQSQALSMEYKKEIPDNELIGMIEKRVHTLYHEIMDNEKMVAFNKAQDVVNAFMAEVNGEITYQITGERPCTHDCSSCGGSCGCGHEH